MRGAAQVPPSPPRARPTIRCVPARPDLLGFAAPPVPCLFVWWVFDRVFVFVGCVAICVLGHRRGRGGVRARLRGGHARLLRRRQDMDGGEFHRLSAPSHSSSRGWVMECWHLWFGSRYCLWILTARKCVLFSLSLPLGLEFGNATFAIVGPL